MHQSLLAAWLSDVETPSSILGQKPLEGASPSVCFADAADLPLLLKVRVRAHAVLGYCVPCGDAEKEVGYGALDWES